MTPNEIQTLIEATHEWIHEYEERVTNGTVHDESMKHDAFFLLKQFMEAVK